MGASDPVAERDRALQLLRAQHTFPGPFSVRVVVAPERRSDVVGAVSAIVGSGSLREIDEKSSRNGTYAAVRVRFVADSAEQVLDVYALLGALDGVRAVM